MFKLFIEKSYLASYSLITKLSQLIIPYLRRFVRFIALPYCYIYLIDWNICNVSKYRVASDLIYIFFKLKYYPDNYSTLWEIDKNKWKYYYGSIYEPYQRRQLTKNVQMDKYKILFEDKYICYQLCSAANFPLPVQLACIGPDDDYKKTIKDIFVNNRRSKIILKPIEGRGGKGISVVFSENDKIIVEKDGDSYDLSCLKLEGYEVVQEYLLQHDLMNSFSRSVNTIRVVTFLTKENSVIFLGAYLRFGIKGAIVDNISSGGIGVGVDIRTGKLNRIAYGARAQKHEFHPDSKKYFDGFEIPYWTETLALVEKIQRYFNFYRLLGHDIAITNSGPVLIELNPEPDMVSLEMKCGPILQNTELLKQFYSNNLLINRQSKRLIKV